MQFFYVPCPDAAVAENIARCLLQEKRVACANILPMMKSLYWWEGRMEETNESLLFLKTALPAEELRHLEARLRELHPAATPCLLRLSPEQVNADYLAWIRDSLK